MTKSESKYFNTAQLMQQALIELLDKKDYSYINVKEICVKAGVNRSTFYLHYDTINDLLQETLESFNKEFLASFNKTSEEFIPKIATAPLDDLYLITSEYLLPYLSFFKEHKKLFKLSNRYSNLMESEKKYEQLKKYVFFPILKRYGVKEEAMEYTINYYVRGVSAIVQTWIENDCKEDINNIVNIILSCVRH